MKVDKECWTHEPEFDKYVFHLSVHLLTMKISQRARENCCSYRLISALAVQLCFSFNLGFAEVKEYLCFCVLGGTQPVYLLWGGSLYDCLNFGPTTFLFFSFRYLHLRIYKPECNKGNHTLLFDFLIPTH